MSEVTPGPAERLAYSVDEVAQITGLSRDLLYDQMRAGRLGYIKVGRRRIIGLVGMGVGVVGIQSQTLG